MIYGPTYQFTNFFASHSLNTKYFVLNITLSPTFHTSVSFLTLSACHFIFSICLSFHLLLYFFPFCKLYHFLHLSLFLISIPIINSLLQFAINRDTLVVKCALLLITKFANANHSGQFFCLWSTKNLRYYSNSLFMCSIYLSVWGWNNIDSFISIPNMLFNSFVISATNCSLLSDTILSGNLCNFHTLSLNNCTNPFADVLSVVATEYIILDNLLQTTRIASFPATNGNFVIKSTVRYIYILIIM